MGHAVPTATTNRARILGVVALVVGVVGAIVLWVLASKRYDDAVADLAPAPVGCDTTLVFDRTGTYTFFVETTGEVGEIDGDCDGDDREYEFDGDETPRVELTLVDDNGDEVDLDRASGPSYDQGGASGSGVRTADIEDTGAYVLRVDSEEDEFMVRVGRDPSSGVVPMRVGRSRVAGGGARPRPDRPDPRAAPGEGPEPAVAGVDRWPPLTGAALSADGAAVRQPAGAAAVRDAAGVAAAGGAGADPRWPAPSADPTAGLTRSRRSRRPPSRYSRRMTVTTRP